MCLNPTIDLKIKPLAQNFQASCIIACLPGAESLVEVDQGYCLRLSCWASCSGFRHGFLTVVFPYFWAWGCILPSRLRVFRIGFRGFSISILGHGRLPNRKQTKGPALNIQQVRPTFGTKARKPEPLCPPTFGILKHEVVNQWLLPPA